MSCAQKLFDTNGAGDVGSFWEADFSGADKCKLVSYETKFSVYNAEDYKRCVCTRKDSANPAKHCPQQNEPPSCDWIVPRKDQIFEILVPITDADKQVIRIDVNEFMEDQTVEYAQCP